MAPRWQFGWIYIAPAQNSRARATSFIRPTGASFQARVAWGSGAICEIVNHQGHQGTRRKFLKPKAFVILRALGGSGCFGS
jgi:hypothetical protein